MFVSSTFQDMQAERDELVLRVFPRLRERCERRGVTWGEVDLRWGILREEALGGRVLPICLQEIERCAPVFIGILGARYGWVPDVLPDELARRLPAGRSVTELEMIHGALEAHHETRPTFYLRALAPDAQIDPRLADLRARVRASGHPVLDGYRDARELGERVHADLERLLDERFPAGSRVDPRAREDEGHARFAERRCSYFLGTEEHFAKLDAHVSRGGPPLVVAGPPGSGKSALLANWVAARSGAGAPAGGALRMTRARWWSRRVPRPPTGLGFVAHFAEATPRSAAREEMLGRLARGLSDYGAQALAREARLRFLQALDSVSPSVSVALVADGIDHVERGRDTPDLAWLPESTRPGVGVIVSSCPGPVLDALRARGARVLELSPLARKQRAVLVADYLAVRHRKRLEAEYARAIAAAPRCANPRHAVTLLAELASSGSFEGLGDAVSAALSAATTAALFERRLRRLAAEFTFLPELSRLLACAREGLSERELRDLLVSSGGGPPPAEFAALMATLREWLSERDGLLALLDGDVARAADATFGEEREARRLRHAAFAAYFAQSPLDGRGGEELPWQLLHAEDGVALQALLSDPAWLAPAFAARPHEVRALWAAAERALGADRRGALTRVVDEPATHAAALPAVQALLREAGFLSDAARLGPALLERARTEAAPDVLADALSAQADLCHALGREREAEELLAEAEIACADDAARLSLCRANRAALTRERGSASESLALAREAEALAARIDHRFARAHALAVQGLAYGDLGDIDAALECFREQERYARAIGDLDGLRASLDDQGQILRARGEHAGARRAHAEAERVCRTLGDMGSLATCLEHRARLELDAGDYDAAFECLSEGERLLRERLEQPAALARLLLLRARLGEALGAPRDAAAFADEALAIARRLRLAPLEREAAEFLARLAG